MTRSITMYMDDRNNNTIEFPSPVERIEKKLITGGLLLELTKSGSIYLICNRKGTHLVLNTDRGTKTYRMSKSYKSYENIKKFFPAHCPGYDSDVVDLGEGITVYINYSGISVVFNSED